MSQLEELRKKAIRPTVPHRTDSFVPPESELEPSANISPLPVKELEKSSDVSHLPLSNKASKKRQKGVRLDEEIADSLERFCLEEKVTIETLIEAAWLEMQNNQKFCQRVLKAAKVRRQKRFKLGRLQAKKTELAALEAEIAKFSD
ncbi:hypothetical protein [Crocosphaera chwakensis]|uniref:Uncharacterized protein n=1 Tax=Crocosphaera chwakensis CCY0110 TaxID=391612 RepID=A3IY51_9CHRO|nr:hypothetical protein [Crocosphaera chwakensis]EAZ88627.1 hypothetical protein CY0110_31520 [Crocosphaera chwakensis CCY0110]